MTDEATAPHQEPGAEVARERKPLSLLASELYGRDYHGSVTEKEPVSEPVEAEEQPETETAQPETGEAVETGESDENTITSLNDLIAHLEADPEWIDSLKVPVKVNGKPAETTLKDLVASYQMNAAAEDRLEDAKSKAKALTQELTQKSEAIQGNFAVTAKLIEQAERLLASDIKSTDWNTLRRDDPAEYAARKADVDARRAEIDQIKSEAVASYQKTQEANAQLMQAEYQKHLQSEQEALLSKLPEWADTDTAKAEKAKLVTYLTRQGFTEQDVMGASDHRLILLARKAMLYDAGVSSADAARKKVAKVPKVLKPGAPKPPKTETQINQEKAADAKARLRQSGRVEDALALLKAKRR